MTTRTRTTTREDNDEDDDDEQKEDDDMEDEDGEVRSSAAWALGLQEEEARLALAAGANPPALGKLIEKEQKIEQELDGLVEGFSRAGFKLSMLLPAIFKAYRKAAGATGPLKESIRKAGQNLRSGETKAAVESLGETNLQLGVFLTDLDRVRSRAIETLAEAEAGERSAYSSLQSALKNARQNKDLAYLIVLDIQGRPAAAFRKDRADQAEFTSTEKETHLSRHGTVYKIVEPVEFDGREIGRL